ncbi:MAG: YwaF family protein [Clostridia bacterium]|nr:YwaF family protein [Clostridia bacterium]
MLKEFFGFGGYQRTPEGYMSWQHLAFVTSLMAIMIFLAVFLGIRNRDKTEKVKNSVLIWAAFLIDGFEIFKIIICCVKEGSLSPILINLPLFLCSIQLITIPLAAFSKGRVKEASIDFVFIFGLLGAVLGTYGAGQNYNAYPVLGFDNVVSGITHSISGFASLYLAISGMAKLKKRNMPITFAIISGFCILAFIADKLIPYNYMFLIRPDGTPYEIFYNLVKGNSIAYPLVVVGMFIVYIFVFYAVYFGIEAHKTKKTSESVKDPDAQEEKV